MNCRWLAWPLLAVVATACQSRRPAPAQPSPDAEAPPLSPVCLLPARDLWRHMADHVRLVPQIRGGAVDGWRLYQLPASGDLWRAGFREGDLITAVDGRPITQPALVPAVGSSKVAFTIQRQGRAVELVCWLR